MNNNQGFFADNGYVQDEYKNESLSVKGKVYGYTIKKIVLNHLYFIMLQRYQK